MYSFHVDLLSFLKHLPPEPSCSAGKPPCTPQPQGLLQQPFSKLLSMPARQNYCTSYQALTFPTKLCAQQQLGADCLP